MPAKQAKFELLRPGQFSADFTTKSYLPANVSASVLRFDNSAMENMQTENVPPDGRTREQRALKPE
jgi:hypothetical protein